MPVITFSKTSDEASANILLTKFYERLQIESNGTAISVLEFIAQVKSNSTFNFSKLDIVIPYVVSKIEDVTDTFTDKNLVTNQLYTNGFEVLNENDRKYKIDGLETYIALLSSDPKIRTEDKYTEIRIQFDKILPGESVAFRLKMTIPKFADIYRSLGVFEFSLYYTWMLSTYLETMREWEANGIPINRKLCEIWITLPQDTLYGKGIPIPQQIQVRHTTQILSNDILDPPRSAVYWDLEDTVFDLPGRPIGDYINPGNGVQIYCETVKPHVTAESFEKKIKTTIDMLDSLIKSIKEAERSLNDITQLGKKSIIITFILSAIAIIIAIISLINSF